MRALYNNKAFKAHFINDDSDDESVICLFTFANTEGFKENITMFGDTVYEKILNIEDIEELYGIDYYVEYLGKDLSASCSPKDNELYLEDTETIFAKQHGFSQVERGVWTKTVNIDDASKFYIKKYDYKMDKSMQFEVSKDEFVKSYHTNIIDLIPY